MRAIITRSWSETAFGYKPGTLGPKIEDFPFLVQKMCMNHFTMQTALKNGVKIYKLWLIMACVRYLVLTQKLRTKNETPEIVSPNWDNSAFLTNDGQARCDVLWSFGP